MDMDELLRENHRRAELLRGAAVGTWTSDLPLERFTFDEQARAHFRLAPDAEVTVAVFYDAVHADDRDRLQAAIESCLATRLPLDTELRIAAVDGEPPRWLRLMGRPACDASGNPLRFDGVTLDVTNHRAADAERERQLEAERAARAEAERLSRVKDEFLATLSHELRTPLNAILGWAQVLGAPGVRPNDLAEGLATIERNARVQTQIIEDLLDMTRIVSGRIRLDVQRVDLASVIRAAIASLQPAADAKELRLQQILDPHAGPVSGDPARLQQVVGNLLNNAIKFTPRGGRVQVVLERVNSHLEIAVNDTGQGIAPDLLPHVFDRSRPRDGTTTRRYGGLGIGLSMVKHLVELHGGYVKAKSGGENQGATFIVALPLAVVHDNESEYDRQHPRSTLSPPPETELPSLEGVKILVVDDEPDVRDILRRVLQQHHAAVYLASGASDAIAILRQERPDVLVSDIGMPNVDGYELIRVIRSLPPEQGGRTPAIALTAFARSEDRRRAMMAGFQVHMAKPVEPPELVATVASLVGRTGK
jgi:signal transduction histidine kinase/CheY-like chemotaxis protein